MITGYENPEQVRSHLSGLRAERRAAAHDKAKVKAIDVAIAIFTAEDERLRAEEARRLARAAEQAQIDADRAAGIGG